MSIWLLGNRLKVAICPLCEWQIPTPSRQAAMPAWERHKENHVSGFRAQLARVDSRGFQLCTVCLPSTGEHRPCYTPDCVCECSC